MTNFQFGLLTASMLALSSSAAFADYELNILHINDFHSRIESINKFDSTCSAEEEGKKECFGGAARLKTAIDQRRAALNGKNTLLLNAGDNFQGSLFYTTYKGAVEAEMLNDMKFDVMTVGTTSSTTARMAWRPSSTRCNSQSFRPMSWPVTAPSSAIASSLRWCLRSAARRLASSAP